MVAFGEPGNVAVITSDDITWKDGELRVMRWTASGHAPKPFAFCVSPCIRGRGGGRANRVIHIEMKCHEQRVRAEAWNVIRITL